VLVTIPILDVTDGDDRLSVVPSATPLSESTPETASPPAALVLISQGSRHGELIPRTKLVEPKGSELSVEYRKLRLQDLPNDVRGLNGRANSVTKDYTRTR